jgi:hypothetical protein
MADEIKRVGKRYFIQSPNKNFFIEPHFLFPLFQFLPKLIQCWLLTHFSIGYYSRQSSRESAIQIIDSIHLLRKREILNLFAGCRLFEERVLGMTKSFVAYAGWNDAS